MQIKELVTFGELRDPISGKRLHILESRLVMRIGDREVAAAIRISPEEYESCRDKQGFYEYTVRELRKSIEREVTNKAFAPLN